MKKFEVIKLADLLTFIGLLFLISTGTLLKFTLPPKSGGASIWGLTRHEWGDIHFYISIIFLLLMTIHLLLHLKFIVKAITGEASREQNYKITIGFVGLITLLALLLAPFFTPVENIGKKNNDRYEKRLH